MFGPVLRAIKVANVGQKVAKHGEKVAKKWLKVARGG
jgi:hypothetical protein